MTRRVTHSPEETVCWGRELATRLRGGTTLALTGDMGAGKTTLCRGIAQGLGCRDPVSSPTFAIVNLYRGPTPLAHFDAWRITGSEDLETAGYYDYLEGGAVVAVEWSGKVAPYLEQPLLEIELRVLGENEREIVLREAEEA